MNIFLIGYRGSGKSSVAPLLAEMLGWTAVDSDEQVQLLTGMTIADIFAEQGEPGFRQWEASVIAGLAQNQKQVVALGGGAVLASDNREQVQRSGFAVWLTAPVEDLWKRISEDSHSDQTRPSLTNQSGIDEVRSVLERRQSLYAECADYTIDTSSRTPKQIADEIANWWKAVDKPK